MIQPKPGEVYWVDLGLKGKLRPLLVVSREDADAERALCAVSYTHLTLPTIYSV